MGRNADNLHTDIHGWSPDNQRKNHRSPWPRQIHTESHASYPDGLQPLLQPVIQQAREILKPALQGTPPETTMQIVNITPEVNLGEYHPLNHTVLIHLPQRDTLDAPGIRGIENLIQEVCHANPQAQKELADCFPRSVLSKTPSYSNVIKDLLTDENESLVQYYSSHSMAKKIC